MPGSFQNNRIFILKGGKQKKPEIMSILDTLFKIVTLLLSMLFRSKESKVTTLDHFTFNTLLMESTT